MNENRRSYQVDILVHDPSIYPPILRYGDAVIVHPAAVVAAISIKYSLRHRYFLKEIKELSSIGRICNSYNIQGPYLAIIGFELDLRSYLYPSRQWENTVRKYCSSIKNYYDNTQNSTPHANEVIDSVITLDGTVIHTSKGKIEQRREYAKIMYGGGSGGNKKEYLMIIEIIEGILKRTNQKI